MLPQVLARPWPAMALSLAMTLAVLAPRLSRPGLWEPAELSRADAALAAVSAERAPGPAASATPPDQSSPTAPAAPPACPRQAPDDAMARSLPARGLAFMIRAGHGDEGGLRVPSLAMGVLTVLAAAGIAARLAGGRAALLAALVLLSFPLLVLQARQLTSEIGTACGSALTIYGLLSLRPIGATLWRAARGRARTPSLGRGLIHLADDGLSLAALAAGLGVGFAAGGALLGVVVPVAAFGAATGAGATGAAMLGRLARHLARALVRLLAPRRALGWRDGRWDWIGDRNASWLGVKSLAAAAAALALLILMARQAYDLGPLEPGTRQVFGQSILPSACYSPLLGAVWQGTDDLRVLYDSSFEQIAFGTFPWGLLAPVAIAWLLAAPARATRLGGALALAWAVAAYLATETFQRKIGFTVYAGFPALALAVALWLDAAMTSTTATTSGEPAAAQRRPGLPALPTAVALYFALGALTLGKDLQTFPDRLASLLVGDDAIKYPAAARFAALAPRVWVLALGLTIAVATALWIWRNQAPPAAQELAARRRPLAIALAATAALAAFWTHGWHNPLSEVLSSKGAFATYHAQRRLGDRLLIQGSLGNAPRYYAGGDYATATSREQVLTALAAPGRAFALVPAGELCGLHRAAQSAKQPLYVLDNDNPRTILISNQIEDRGGDRNPLLAALMRDEPAGIRQRPPSRIVFDDRIELIGWDVPAQVEAGDPFHVTLYYKILAPIGGTWRVFQHYDRPGSRFLGDHTPIDGRCPTSDWQAGDYIVDRYRVSATSGAGTYDLWTGFFAGSAPSWQNMPITMAPPQARDPEHRVKIATVRLR